MSYIPGIPIGAGAGGSKTLPAQVTDLACVAGDTVINLSFTGVPATSEAVLKDYVVVYKQGGIPTSPSDGQRVVLEKISGGGVLYSTTLTACANDVQYVVRVYPRGLTGQYQTALEGATAFCTPKKGIEIGTLSVGSRIRLKIGGTSWNFRMVHKGRPSNLYGDSFLDAAVFMVEDIYELHKMSGETKNTYYPNTLMAAHLEVIYSRFTDKARSIMKTVKIPYINWTGNNSATTASGENGFSVKLFLPALRELSAYNVAWSTEDGTRFSWFSADTAEQRKAYDKGLIASYWLRSVAVSSESFFANNYIYVNEIGYFNYSSSPNDKIGLRFCLVLPNSALVYPPDADGVCGFIE